MTWRVKTSERLYTNANIAFFVRQLQHSLFCDSLRGRDGRQQRGAAAAATVECEHRWNEKRTGRTWRSRSAAAAWNATATVDIVRTNQVELGLNSFDPLVVVNRMYKTVQYSCVMCWMLLSVICGHDVDVMCVCVCVCVCVREREREREAEIEILWIVCQWAIT